MSRRPVLIAVVALLVAAIGSWQLLVKPPRQDADAVQGQITTQRDALTAAQAQLQTLQSAKAQYRAAYAEVVRLGKAVPEDDDLQSLLVQLSATAKRSGVEFLSLDRADGGGSGAVSTGSSATTQTQLPPGVTVGASGFGTLGLKLTFTGRYFELADFLRRIDGYVRTGTAIRVRGRLLTIDGVKLTPLGTARSRTLTAEVDATAYVVSPTEGATGGATGSGPAALSGAVSATPTPATGSAG